MSSSKLAIPNRPVITKQFIEKNIGEAVKDYTISTGSNPGDNVMGSLLCIKVTVQNGFQHHLVIKSVLPMTGDIDENVLSNSEMIAGSSAFIKEISYYDRLRPLFVEAWNSNKEKAMFFTPPKVHGCVHDTTSKGLHDYIVMEDLRPQGYKMADKYIGLSHDEIVETLKGLALLHATSYSLLNGNGPLSSEIKAIMEDPKTLTAVHGWDKDLIKGADQEVFFDGIVDKMIELVKESGENETAEKIQQVAKDGHKRLLIGLWNKTTENGKYFRVLVHADLWTNNVLFKYGPDGKSVQDVKFIDFQMNHFGNIYEDLHYFVFTSSTADFRKAHLRSCLQVYYQEFEKTLQELGCDMPTGFTEESFLATFHETLDYGFVFNLMAIPFQVGLPLSPANEDVKCLEDNQNPIQSVQTDTNDEGLKIQKTLMELVGHLKISARNSPIALQRLREMINEMFELGVLS